MSIIDDDRIKKIASMAEKEKQAVSKNWNVESIFQKLNEIIIGNNSYKKSLSYSISRYLDDNNQRSHIIVFGPSGTGKTYLLEESLPSFEIPYHIVDTSSLVPSGYSGNTLKSSLEDFFKHNNSASNRSIIVLDEFDKLSEKANGGDTHKSHSIQGELLTLIQGKKEGIIDTRNSLWILLGAFAYTDEMKTIPPTLSKNKLLNYGFKNELLGRITLETITDIPSVEDVVRRIANDKNLSKFIDSLEKDGWKIDFNDDAFLYLALKAQEPEYGMRIIPSILGALSIYIVHDIPKGSFVITKEIMEKVIE